MQKEPVSAWSPQPLPGRICAPRRITSASSRAISWSNRSKSGEVGIAVRGAAVCTFAFCRCFQASIALRHSAHWKSPKKSGSVQKIPAPLELIVGSIGGGSSDWLNPGAASARLATSRAIAAEKDRRLGNVRYMADLVSRRRKMQTELVILTLTDRASSAKRWNLFPDRQARAVPALDERAPRGLQPGGAFLSLDRL